MAVDLGPVACDLEVARGDSPIIPVTVRNLDGTIRDVTGSSSVMTVDPEPDPADALNNLFSVAGAIQAPGTDGRIDFQPTEVNLDLTPDTYFYDIEVLFATGERRTVLEGKFVVTQDKSK